MTGDRLGRYLLEHGRVTGAQLDEARRTRSFFGGDLGTHLVRLGYLSDVDLGEALSVLSGTPCADPHLRSVPPDVLRRVPREVAERHTLCPIGFDGSTLRVAMRNPRDVLAIGSIRTTTGFDVEPWIASEHRLEQALRRHYGIRREGVEGVRLKVSGTGSPLSSPPGGPTGPEDTPLDNPDGDLPDERIGLDGLPLDADVSPLDTGVFGSVRAPEPDEIDGADPGVPTTPAASRATPEAADATRGGGTPATAPPGDDENDEPVDDPWPADPLPDAEPTDPFERLMERLELAVDGSDVAVALMDFCRLRAARCALFAVGRDGLRCLAGRGRAFNTDRMQRATIPTGTGTVLDRALDAGEFYLGPVPPSPENKDLYSLLGGRLPPSILVVPVRLRGRLVSVLYLDNDAEPITAPDLPLMRRIAAKASLAFEILLLRRKLREA